MIFSEGKHHDKYFLLPISKGSSRIGLESQYLKMRKVILGFYIMGQKIALVNLI